MKQRLTLLLLILLLAIGYTHAQVTIGMDEKPEDGALLQLKNKANAADGSNATKGLLLPRVKLTSLTISSGNDLKTTITGATGTSVWDKNAHVGMLIFHVGNNALATTHALYLPNVYVWTGEEWLLVKATI